MKDNRRFMILGWGLCILSLITSTIGIFSLAAFVKKAGDETGFQGDVGLRNYYQKGSGALGDPFVISRPLHFYNLSRLQALGLYSDPANPVYFQLGYDPNDGDNLRFFADDTSSTMVDVLDMSAYDGTSESKTIHSIGSEAFPFCGRFDGKGLQVSNLTVYGDPQDVGVFGYTYSGSKVENIMFENLTVTCRGYDTANFHDLFTSSLSPNIKINGTEISTSGSVTVTQGTPLEVTFDDPQSEYTTQIASSSEYFRSTNNNKKLTLIPAGTHDADGNIISVYDLFTAYRGSYPATINSRISIIAHKIVAGVPTARVVSVYTAAFTKLSESSSISLTVNRVNQENHGCNIGFVVGHCDGSLSKIYVHDGTLDINPEVTGRTTLAQKSEYGLIGLIGSSVNNTYKGTAGTAGVEGTDIGVVDFSAIYDDIIDPSTANFTYVSKGTYTYTPADDTAYEDYLRYRFASDTVRYTYAPDTVSLRGRSVIQDTLEKDYGLGVFTVVTDTMTEGNGSSFYNVRLDRCMIEKGNSVSDIYYTTAEWHNDNLANASNWGGSNYGDGRVSPGYYIPDDYDFGVSGEKNHNYIFRTALDSSSSRFYFADADTTKKGGNFIGEYFHHKLVDSGGNPIPKTNTMCGVMVKDKEGDNIGSFSSSLHLPNKSNDESDNLHYMDHDGETMISRTVNFAIKAATANVTVIAKKADVATGEAQVGIYNVDNITPGNNLVTDRNYAKPDYAMYIPSDNDFAYFDYQGGLVGNSASGSFAESRYCNIDHSSGSTSGKLFAHTFTLPQGNYAIATSSNDCYLYYVCAQGQDAGDYTTAGTIQSSVNTIDFVDFAKFGTYILNDQGQLVSAFNFDHPELGRCFLSLNQANVSHFTTGHVSLSFTYDDSDGEYYILAGDSGQQAAITSISSVNYGKFKLTVHLINRTSNEETINWPAS